MCREEMKQSSNNLIIRLGKHVSEESNRLSGIKVIFNLLEKACSSASLELYALATTVSYIQNGIYYKVVTVIVKLIVT